MTNATTDRYQLDLDGMRAVAIPIEAGTQPWPPRRECYRAEVTVNVPPDADSYQVVFHGSQADFERGERVDLRDAAWSVVDELLSAAYDPDEFWSMAVEGGDFNRENIEAVLRTLDFAKRAEPVLDRNADRLEAWRDQS